MSIDYDGLDYEGIAFTIDRDQAPEPRSEEWKNAWSLAPTKDEADKTINRAEALDRALDWEEADQENEAAIFIKPIGIGDYREMTREEVREIVLIDNG